MCQEAAMNAMEEDINAREVSYRHFVKAISNVTPRITLEMLEFYRTFQERSGLKEC